MRKHPQDKVVPIPLLKGGSIEETLSGFPSQIGVDGPMGRRVEHDLSVLVAEIRGWHHVWDALGSDRGSLALGRTVDRALHAVESLGGRDIALGGGTTQPILTVSFSDGDHAMRAVVAAEALRDAVAQPLDPAVDARFRACVGVNTGAVVDTHVNGSGLSFSASGTTRMFAVRLQEFAGPDQVFISEATYRAVPARLAVVPIGPVRTSGDGETQEAYLVRGLLEPASR